MPENNRSNSAPQGGEWQSSQKAQSAAPSTGTDSRGEEGSILDGAETHRGTDEEASRQGSSGASTQGSRQEASGRQQQPSSGNRSTGAGSEAAEGMHAAGGRSQGDQSAVEGKETGRSERAGEDRSGSEPMTASRSTEHKGSYGGEGGAPRTSSNEREPNERR